MIFKQKLSSLLLKQFNHVYNNQKVSIFGFNYSNITKKHSRRNNLFMSNLNREYSNGINNNNLVENKKAKFNRHNGNSRNLIKEWQKSKPQDEPSQKRTNRNFDRLEEEILFRREEAKKSVLIKTKVTSNNNEIACLVHDLESIGCRINNIFVYKNKTSSTNNESALNVLVEFKTMQCVQVLLNNYSENFAGELIPCRSRNLFYATPNNRNSNISSQTLQKIHYMETSSVNSTITVSHLKQFDDCNEQIKELYRYNKLNELSYRTRFFIASLIEDFLKGLFHQCFCLPFGSSLNKTGSRTSDLDLNLSLSSQLDFLKTSSNFNKKFLFISKTIEYKNKKASKPHFDLVDYLITFVLPKFETTSVIANCTVPIIKFDFFINSKINCDLSMSHTKHSFEMTKLFWIYSNIDERVSPLVFLIRYWANLWGLMTKARPSPNFTNFQLTFLVFNFLLRMENPIILPLEDVMEMNSIQSILKNISSKNDEGSHDYVTKKLSISEFKNLIKTKNNIKLNELFERFLEYYSNNDVFNYNISLKRELINNKEKKFFMENPLDPQTNAAKNVTIHEIERLKNSCEQTLQIIASIKDKGTNNFDLLKLLGVIDNKRLIKK